jgi:hypothetical protein
LRIYGGVIFELEEEGEKFEVGTFGGNISWNGTCPADIDQTKPVSHTWTIYSEPSFERYDNTRHYITNVKERHHWVGEDIFGDPVIETTVVSLLEYDNFLNLGQPLRIKAGAQVNAEHRIKRAEFLGERIEFDASLNGFFTSTITDPFGNVSTGSITVTMGDGTAYARAETSTTSVNPGSQAWVEFISDHLPSMNWNVNFFPKDVNGQAVTGKQAIVVMGDIQNTEPLGSHQTRVGNFIQYAEVPFSRSFGLPRERIYTYRRVQCYSNYTGTPSSRNTTIDVISTLQEKIWSTRNTLAVVMSKTAFGISVGSILDDLNATSSLNWAVVESYRKTKARYTTSAGGTYVSRAGVKLVPKTSFATNDWFYFPPSSASVAVGSNVLAAPSGSSRDFITRFGQTGFTSVKFQPYRFAVLDLETDEDLVSFILEIEASDGAGFAGGTKAYLLTLKKGRRTIKFDLRDPDLVNDVVRDELPLAVDRNPMNIIFSPASYTDYGSRFEGFGPVYQAKVKLSAGQSLTFHEFALEATEALLIPGSANLGGEIDEGDYWRTPNTDAEQISLILEGQRCVLTDENWAVDAGWIRPYIGSVSCVDASFTPVAPLNLVAGDTLRSTALSTFFISYWGMSEGPMIGGAPVVASFEYIWGNRVSAMSVPPTESKVRLTNLPLPAPGREFVTEKDGLVIHGETTHIRPASTGGVSAYVVRHPEPRIEVTQWGGNQNGTWSGIQFDPRGAGKKPSRDRNAGQRHIRASVQGGLLSLSYKGNFEADEWISNTTTLRCQSACARIDHRTKEQRVYLLVEILRSIWVYTCTLDGQNLAPVRQLAAGEYPTLVILTGGRKCCYWIAGGFALGAILGGNDEVIRETFVVQEGVLSLHLSSGTGQGAGGELGVWLTLIKEGAMRHLYSRDGIQFEQRGPDAPYGQGVEVVDTRGGRRFIYTVPDGSTNVWVEVRGQDGQIILPGQVAFAGVDEGTLVAVRHAVGRGGKLYFAMTAVIGGEVAELSSPDGLSFS